MSIKKLKEIIQLAKEEGVSKLSYKDGEEEYSVSFAQIYSSAHSNTFLENKSLETQKASSLVKQVQPKSSEYHIITSPFVGTFYASPSPGDPSFVEIGQQVSPGQTLCILEAMKIMNEIESDVTGELVEVLVENEGLVEFGQELFKIKLG